MEAADALPTPEKKQQRQKILHSNRPQATTTNRRRFICQRSSFTAIATRSIPSSTIEIDGEQP